MTTTTVVTVTCQAPPSSPLSSISMTSKDFHYKLTSSISGNLEDDYTLVPLGIDETQMHLTVKKSYKSRFHQVQAEWDLLMTSQVYNEILSGNYLATYTPSIY